MKFTFQLGSLKPQDLIKFTEQYLKDLPILKQVLTESLAKNQQTAVTVKRLNLHNVEFSTKIVHGKVTSINGNHFTMMTDYIETIGGGKTIISNEMVIRFDSLLGEIPVLNHNVIPCEINHEHNKEYAQFIKKVCAKLKKVEGTGKKITAVYKNFSENNESDYFFQGKVVKVNRSNMEVRIDYDKKTSVSNPNNYVYTSIAHDAVTPFLQAEQILVEVRIAA